MYRTHHCNELRKADIGREVKLAGWVQCHARSWRRHFHRSARSRRTNADGFSPGRKCRGRKAIAQLAERKTSFRLTGRVAPRLPGTENPKLATGDIEVLAESVDDSESRRGSSVSSSIAELSNEDLALTYRYFDLRRPRSRAICALRHRVTKATRDYLDAQGFLEIETPILSKSTPEGARDFLVPSRLTPGKILRAAAGAAAIQTTAHGRRHGKIFSDREMLFAMKICGPIASRSSPRSTSKRHSSSRTTFTR